MDEDLLDTSPSAAAPASMSSYELPSTKKKLGGRLKSLRRAVSKVMRTALKKKGAEEAVAAFDGPLRRAAMRPNKANARPAQSKQQMNARSLAMEASFQKKTTEQRKMQRNKTRARGKKMANFFGDSQVKCMSVI